MLLGSDKSAGIGMLRNLKRVFTASAYPFTVAERRTLNAFIINAALDILDVDGDYSLVSGIRSAWIRYSKDICPLDVMSLPGGLRFKVCTLS